MDATDEVELAFMVTGFEDTPEIREIFFRGWMAGAEAFKNVIAQRFEERNIRLF